ncbi:EAL domain, c-di-GMP-specific phosphodiesterase class I (or its enzymatically inactive variant) [Mesobacillus persicus]|uniref:EAL domain, c-di-GMP-specific phosphodiesterase class I (Or its enzymatically inactive variant) n=1 Tax=Mesobacillus persicus TaxID=930146 RepID=A0A1H8E252_9BACI|nr:EAL domain-containing protein [Mesobacillus persicus]SEN13552.1 EAL domain, c-di-GMP-specific phosphodiesterase class I (or its enzymatically inactive variant) [Mesobacillus persicus]
MTKSFSCIYDNDAQLDCFVKENGLLDVSNLLIQIFSKEEGYLVSLHEQMKQRFPSATIMGFSPTEMTPTRKVRKGKVFLSFTTIEEKNIKLAYYDYESVLRFELSNHLQKALERKELFLCYQPLVCLRTGEMISSEALLRWEHPKLGPISPARFIPVAEEMGFIQEIGAWVLNSACKQTKAWQLKGMHQLGVCVNVSAKQFLNPSFLDEVKLALKVSGLEAQYLTLELTESTMFQNLDESIDIMKALRNTGINVSIDDFGTGYSSLSYLKYLPINSLKIDQAFVNSLQATPIDTAIVKAIITMGEVLSVDIVAEGVETKVQADLLRELNCQYAQGYYIKKPLIADEFEVFAQQLIMS